MADENENKNEQVETFIEGDQTPKPEGSSTETPTASPAETGEETQTTTSEPKKDEPQMVPVAEVARQRDRRRKAEAKSADLEKRLAFLEGKVSSQPAPDPVDPEEEAERFLERPKENVEALMEAREWRTICRVTTAAAKRAYEDYDEMEQIFRDAADKDASLATALRNSEDPAEFAYRYGKNKTATEGFKSVEEMKAAWEKEHAERIREEVRKEEADRIAGSQPTTQAQAPGHGGAKEPPAPATSLADILPTKEMTN
jgi:hypothetical protein